METWYKVTLPSKECGINGKATFMQREFEHFFLTSCDATKDVALFTNHDENFANHFFYFSPAAVRIAELLIKGFNGVPCAQPLLADDMILLVGHSGARKALLRAAGNS
jgi:hypothetical protein